VICAQENALGERHNCPGLQAAQPLGVTSEILEKIAFEHTGSSKFLNAVQALREALRARGDEGTPPLTWETFWQQVRERDWNPTPEQMRRILAERQPRVHEGTLTAAEFCDSGECWCHASICEPELRLIEEHGEPMGIRDRTGFLVRFNPVPKFEGQDARYQGERARRRRLADFILACLIMREATDAARI
jgi:hypothetical protein